MKIESINFVKASDIPSGPVRNKETAMAIEQLHERLKKVPEGQVLSFTSKDAKKYTRYALQKRLQKKGNKIVVRVQHDAKLGYTFYIVKVA